MRWLRCAKAALLAALAATLPTGAVRSGEIVYGLSAPSAALGRAIPYTLYKPASGSEPLPVLYLFHGAGGTERDWADAGHAQDTLDRLIAEGTIKPVLVVMPMAGDSWYVDNPDAGGAGLMARALTRDLVGHVDGTYSTASCREARALGGLSMGGYGALLYAMDNPDRFVAAFSMSGSIFKPMRSDAEVDVAPPARVFRGAFGTPFDRARFNAANLFARIPAYAAAHPRAAMFLAIGDDDFPRLRDGNTAFRLALAASGVEVEFRTNPGGHIWPLWSAQLASALVWLDRQLTARCPT